MKAFSLIELMVVIAIIAVLATVAIPAYQQYRTKAVASKAQAIIDGLMTQASVYQQQHGVAPSAYDLGLTSNPAPANRFIADNTNTQNFLTNINSSWTASNVNGLLQVINMNQTFGANFCNTAREIYLEVNAANTEIPDMPGIKQFTMDCYSFVVDGIQNQECQVSFYDTFNNLLETRPPFGYAPNDTTAPHNDGSCGPLSTCLQTYISSLPCN